MIFQKVFYNVYQPPIINNNNLIALLNNKEEKQISYSKWNSAIPTIIHDFPRCGCSYLSWRWHKRKWQIHLHTVSPSFCFTNAWKIFV